MSQEAAGAGGNFFSSMTAMFGTVAEVNSIRASADVDKENARLAELEGAFQGEAIRRQGRAVQGEAISALAADGVSVGEGSAQDLLFQNALETEYAVLATRYSAATEARGLRMSAKMKRQQARAALIGGIMGAGARALGAGVDAQNRSEVEAARTRRENSYFPGAMRLPQPPPPPDSFTGPRY